MALAALACLSFAGASASTYGHDGQDPDVGLSMEAIVRARGYPIERHNVTTDDGFILGMFRIPRSPFTAKKRSGDAPRPPVLLQHGLLDSSYTWVSNYRTESLAYVLSDMGYDVWLSNSRGNFFSMAHTKYDPDSKEFWDFTWDDMARFDLPANIDYILQATGVSKVSAYIGHSQGTIQAFAGFSLQPALSEKVSLFAALAPVAYVNHQKSPVFSLLADLDVDEMFMLFGFKEFLPDATILQKLAPGICDWVPHGCDDFLFLICGESNHVNATRLPVYLAQTPAGTSVRNMHHWAQNVRHGHFQMYDYGCGTFSCPNEEHYGTKTPPQYNLTSITIPVALFSGGADDLADPTDVSLLLAALPQSLVVHHDQTPTAAHLDFTWADDLPKWLYPNLLPVLKKYTKGELVD